MLGVCIFILCLCSSKEVHGLCIGSHAATKSIRKLFATAQEMGWQSDHKDLDFLDSMFAESAWLSLHIIFPCLVVSGGLGSGTGSIGTLGTAYCPRFIRRLMAMGQTRLQVPF